MKCAAHTDREATALCVNCLRGVCAECAGIYDDVVTCRSCTEVVHQQLEAKSFTPEERRRYRNEIIGASIIGMLLLAFSWIDQRFGLTPFADLWQKLGMILIFLPIWLVLLVYLHRWTAWLSVRKKAKKRP